MKILAWYTTIIMTLGYFFTAVDYLDAFDFGGFFILLILGAPILYYLWKVLFHLQEKNYLVSSDKIN